MSLTVGTAAKPSEHAVYVHGRTTLGASETVQITATKTVEFLCGTSVLRLKPDGIELVADTLTLKAKKSISASSGEKGPSLVIDEQATLKSKKVSVLAENATLQLDDKGVKLQGEQIKLDCAPEKPPEPKTDEEKAETKKMMVQLTDAELKPLANMKYHVQVAGQKLEGTTDADGVVEQTVPISAATATIMLWPSDYPTGQYNQYEVELLEALPPVETVRGAKTRLRNLGYYQGAVDDHDNRAFQDALSTMQLDFGLSRSGKLDADTLKQLEHVHTS
jgi:type VI secretion system secreted protein VgrG